MKTIKDNSNVLQILISGGLIVNAVIFYLFFFFFFFCSCILVSRQKCLNPNMSCCMQLCPNNKIS